MQDIHGLKPLMTMDFPWLSVALFAMSLLLVLGVVLWVLWKLWKRPRAQKPVAEAPPAPPPPREDYREAALKALQKLSPRADNPEAFYSGLERIFRNYLSDHYGENMTSHTASELAQFLQRQSPLQKNHLLSTLQHGEQAKFARQALTPEIQEKDCEQIQNFIQHQAPGDSKS